MSGTEFSDDPLVRDFAELEVIRQLQGMVVGMASRALGLVRYLNTVEQQVARDYLLRVARCYVFGMHPETVVMCGAVLEAVLDAWLPIDDKVRTLGMKIAELEGGVLTGEALEAAKRINKMRTDAVHLRLECLPGDAISTIEMLAEVLSHLSLD